MKENALRHLNIASIVGKSWQKKFKIFRTIMIPVSLKQFSSTNDIRFAPDKICWNILQLKA